MRSNDGPGLAKPSQRLSDIIRNRYEIARTPTCGAIAQVNKLGGVAQPAGAGLKNGPGRVPTERAAARRMR